MLIRGHTTQLGDFSMSSITLIIVLMGLLTVVLSILVAADFHRQTKGLYGSTKLLSRALSLQLVGEAIIGGGTLFFALAAHFGYLPHLDGSIQAAIRMFMFLATSITTLHLWLLMRKIHRGGRDC